MAIIPPSERIDLPNECRFNPHYEQQQTYFKLGKAQIKNTPFRTK